MSNGPNGLTLSISETAGVPGQPGATGVLKVEHVAPGQDEIFLDGNNSGAFADTGISLEHLSSSIKIDAGLSFGSQFIIDNTGGGFFSSLQGFSGAFSGFVPSAATPTFIYVGSDTGLPPPNNTLAPTNSGLTVRGRSDRDDAFTVSNLAQTIGPRNPDGTIGPKTGVASGLAGDLNVAEQTPTTFVAINMFVHFSVVTGVLALDGAGGAAGGAGDVLSDNFPAGNSTWKVATDAAGNQEIQGPQAPPLPSDPPIVPNTLGHMDFSNFANGLVLGAPAAGTFANVNIDISSTNSPVTVNGGNNITVHEPLAKNVNLFATPGLTGVPGTATANSVLPNIAVEGTGGGDNFFVGPSTDPAFPDFLTVARTTSAAVTDPDVTNPSLPGVLDPPESTHLGGDVNFPFVTTIPTVVGGNSSTGPSINLLELDGISGNNVFTLHQPPIATELPPTIVFNGSVPASFVPPRGTLPPPIGDNRLRVIGNPPIPGVTSGADTIKVGDLGTDPIQMTKIQSLVIYGLGGDDTLSNDSKGNVATGIPAVPALIIAGDGKSTEAGLNGQVATMASTDMATISTGAGNDVVLGGSDGVYDITGNDLKFAQSYFFPHQDEFGDIFDVGGSSITSGKGSDTVVAGLRKAQTFNDLGDMDTVTGFNNKAQGNTGTDIPTVDSANPISYLYEPTPALLAQEQAFASNKAVLEEFGPNVNLRAQFTTYNSFVGRAYDAYLIGRNGRTSVAQQELGFWDAQGLPLEQVMALLLASNERRAFDAQSTTWANDLAVDTLDLNLTAPLQADGSRAALFVVDENGNPVTGSNGGILPGLLNQILNTYALPLETQGDTPALRYQEALQFLTSPLGRTLLIYQLYATVLPATTTGVGTTAERTLPARPSLVDQQAIQSELASGTSLTQVANILAQSGGHFLSYEVAHSLGELGYVGGLYNSLLLRNGNFGINELAYWAQQHAAGVSNQQITVALLNAPEHRTFVINADYERYLLRPVDPGGLNFWQGYLAAGGLEENLVSAIAASPEYYARNGGTSDSFVLALYRDVLQRTTAPAQPEVDYWIATMAASERGAEQARADVVTAFQFSDEYRISQVNQWYEQFLGRLPSQTELGNALFMFHAGETQQQVEASILVGLQTFGSSVTII